MRPEPIMFPPPAGVTCQPLQENGVTRPLGSTLTAPGIARGHRTAGRWIPPSATKLRVCGAGQHLVALDAVATSKNAHRALMTRGIKDCYA